MKQWVIDHTPHIISGFVVGCLGYFKPINGIIALMTASIFIDFIVGVYVAYKTGQAIQSRKMWRTLEKLLVCLTIVMLCYSAYVELGCVKLYIVAGWAVFGFEMWSILESIAKINNSKLFNFLKKVMETNIEKQTGVKIGDDEAN